MIDVVTADLGLASHAQAFLLLLDTYAADETGGGQPLTSYARDNLVPALRERPGARVILAFVDGEPAGLLVCIEGFSTFACKPLLNIHDVIVLAAYRGRGLFRRMLEQAEAVARQLGCCKLTLEVLEGNHVAQAAYRATGFEGYELDPKLGKAMFWQKKL